MRSILDPTRYRETIGYILRPITSLVMELFLFCDCYSLFQWLALAIAMAGRASCQWYRLPWVCYASLVSLHPLAQNLDRSYLVLRTHFSTRRMIRSIHWNISLPIFWQRSLSVSPTFCFQCDDIQMGYFTQSFRSYNHRGFRSKLLHIQMGHKIHVIHGYWRI